jgi:hypothetical protein
MDRGYLLHLEPLTHLFAEGEDDDPGSTLLHFGLLGVAFGRKVVADGQVKGPRGDAPLYVIAGWEGG